MLAMHQIKEDLIVPTYSTIHPFLNFAYLDVLNFPHVASQYLIILHKMLDGYLWLKLCEMSVYSIPPLF